MEDLPEVTKQDEPILAWKCASIQIGYSEWDMMLLFCSLNAVTYKQTDVFECTRKHDKTHKGPIDKIDPLCTCGFYACKTTSSIPYKESWLLEVELYGTVIEGDNGWYRASKQRVISAQPPIMCENCNEDISEVFGLVGRYVHVLCRRCLATGQIPVLEKETIARMLGCEIKAHPLMAKTSPSTYINVPVHVETKGGHDPFNLPMQLSGSFIENYMFQTQVPFSKSASMPYIFRFQTDATGSGFMIEMITADGWIAGRWHFQCQK